MPNLKDLKIRINSVKSTQKITSAMKMVAAAKLRRAQEQAEAARPYAERMERVLGSLAASMAGIDGAPELLAGTGKDQVHLVVVMTSDRGLCGGFNGSIVRSARALVNDLLRQGKTVKIVTVGRKGRDQLKREFSANIIESYEGIGRKGVEFGEANRIANFVSDLFERGEFDVCTIIYNRFHSVISQIPTEMRLIPAPMPEVKDDTPPARRAVYEFEPDEETLLQRLLPQNLAIQIYRALLESSAGFFGAQMTAMDSATRNAGEMIKRLTLNYNRARQANITKELIEIISGAEAV